MQQEYTAADWYWFEDMCNSFPPPTFPPGTTAAIIPSKPHLCLLISLSVAYSSVACSGSWLCRRLLSFGEGYACLSPHLVVPAIALSSDVLRPPSLPLLPPHTHHPRTHVPVCTRTHAFSCTQRHIHVCMYKLLHLPMDVTMHTHIFMHMHLQIHASYPISEAGQHRNRARLWQIYHEDLPLPAMRRDV